MDADARALLDFTSRLIQLRLEEPVLRRRSFFQGRALRGSSVRDIEWLDADGAEVSDVAWRSELQSFGMLLSAMP